MLLIANGFVVIIYANRKLPKKSENC